MNVRPCTYYIKEYTFTIICIINYRSINNLSFDLFLCLVLFFITTLNSIYLNIIFLQAIIIKNKNLDTYIYQPNIHGH